jgi:hypothetical protein
MKTMPFYSTAAHSEEKNGARANECRSQGGCPQWAIDQARVLVGVGQGNPAGPGDTTPNRSTKVATAAATDASYSFETYPMDAKAA